MEPDKLREIVKGEYRQAALQVGSGGRSCCGAVSQETKFNSITTGLYSEDEMRGLPHEAVLASFGCGNPTELAELRAGETVLDLGSGGGIDVLLSGKRVGPTGKAYGLDMTDEMLELARQNQAKAGVSM
jgi:arsenite methyltransferase